MEPAASARLMGLNEDEAALRDAVPLTAPGDPGPVCKVFLAYKRLATLAIPAAERAGGSVRCTMAGIQLTPRA